MVKKAYAFMKPCGHAALLVADHQQALKDSSDDIKWALDQDYQMKHVDLVQIHDGLIRMCGDDCQ